MDTLMQAGTIRSIKEVWPDVRPHPDFGTVETRMLGGVPIRREVGITDAAAATAPLRGGLYELHEELQPVAQRLGCADELKVVHEVLEGGASYKRQRTVVATGGGLTDVVDVLVTEFAEDRFVGTGEDRDGGP